MRALVLGLASLLFAGCDTRPALPVEEVDLCATVNQRHVVSVVLPDGSAALTLQARSVVVTTNEVLASGGSADDGTYLVVDDRSANAFADGSRIVRFTATNLTHIASADFVFEFDGCHVVKVSGPSVVSARPRG